MYATCLMLLLPLVTGIPIGNNTQPPPLYFWGDGDVLIPYSVDESEEAEIYSDEPKPTDVSFIFYNSKHVEEGLEVQLGEKSNTLSLNKSYSIAPESNFYVIIHGFTETGNKQWVQAMKKALLTFDPKSEVMIVDWGKLCRAPWYVSSARNTHFTGDLVHTVIKNLLDSKTLLMEKVHLIGFSLGAQVAGVAGFLLSRYGLTVGRITGLDPAYPLFGTSKLEKRLDKTDATFVDIIHTNAAYILVNGVGYPEDVGHIDFWPNGGSNQPGCGVRGADPIDMMSACSHNRAHDYFMESILNGDGFGATACISWKKFKKGKCDKNDKATMGMFVNRKNQGTFYLRTNSRSPFGIL